MASKNIAVYGIYKDRSMAENAVDELKQSGFRAADISVLLPDGQGTKEFAIEKETKTPEGATTGAGTGAVIGGTLGWLTGIGVLAIPGLGPFIAAGPIMAALAGVGAGGLVGGIAGALIGMGIPEYEANRYEEHIKEGGILLSVHVDDTDWKNKAKEILERSGAEDIGYKGESDADRQASGESTTVRSADQTSYADRTSEASYMGGRKDAMENTRGENMRGNFQSGREDLDYSKEKSFVQRTEPSLSTGQVSSNFANEKRQSGFERRKGDRRISGTHISVSPESQM